MPPGPALSPLWQCCTHREVELHVGAFQHVILKPTCSFCEWLDSCLEVSVSCGEVMLVVTVIHDKGHLLPGGMNGKDISKL